MTIAGSCGRSEEGIASSVVTSDTLEVVTNPSTPRMRQPLYDVTLETVIGIDEGQPEWQIFGNHIGMTLGSDACMFILDEPGGTIKVVSSSGDLLVEFGRHGSGPGEYSLGSENWWIESHNELWVGDFALHRVTRFSEDGTLISTIPIPVDAGVILNMRHLGAGKFLGFRRRSVGLIDMADYGFLGKDLRWVRDFVSVPQQRMWTASDGSKIAFPLKYDIRAEVLPMPDGRILVTDPVNQWITIYTGEGAPQVQFTREWNPPSVDRTEKEKWYRQAMQFSDRSSVDAAGFPLHRTLFLTVTVDSESRIWVMRPQTAEEERTEREFYYDVFDSMGMWLAVQPLDFAPSVIRGRYMYEVSQGGEESGPRIRRYLLREKGLPSDLPKL